MNERTKGGKPFNIALALFLALLLWLYVINVENPNTTMKLRGVQVTVQGISELEEHGLMVTDLSRETMTLRVTGGRRSFVRLTPNIVTVSLDVSRIRQPGEHVLYGSYSIRDSSLQSAVTVRETDNFAVTVTVEERAAKQIPIQGEFVGTLASGYEVESMEISESMVKITGPKNVMQSINHAVVMPSGEQVSTEQSYEALPLQLVGHDGTIIQDDNVTCAIESVAVTLQVVKVYELPLVVTIDPGGGVEEQDAIVSIAPTSITVSGSEERMAELSEIHLGRINLSDVFLSSEKTFSVVMPAGIQNRSDVTSATVHVNLAKCPMRSLLVTRIDLINVPEGYGANLVNSSLQIWVRGEADALEQLTAAQVQVTVDLASAAPAEGLQRFAARVYLVDETKIGVVGSDYSVAVELKRR